MDFLPFVLGELPGQRRLWVPSPSPRTPREHMHLPQPRCPKSSAVRVQKAMLSTALQLAGWGGTLQEGDRQGRGLGRGFCRDLWTGGAVQMAGPQSPCGTSLGRSSRDSFMRAM